MQPALDSNILGHLISLGRERGHLTTADLRASLPIESMSAEEIALVVVQLEETGVPVELEESLRAANPRPKPAPVPRRSAEIIPFPAHRVKRRTSEAKRPAPPRPAAAQPSQAPTEAEAPPVHWIIAAIGVLAFTVASLVVFAAV